MGELDRLRGKGKNSKTERRKMFGKKKDEKTWKGVVYYRRAVRLIKIYVCDREKSKKR